MIKKILKEPLIVGIVIMVIAIFVLLHRIGEFEEKRQLKVDNVLNNCPKSGMVSIYKGFVMPIYDCSTLEEYNEP